MAVAVKMSISRLVACSRVVAASAAAVLVAMSPVLAGDPGWSTVAMPSLLPAQAIGGHARGCVAGAVPLPLDGPGYQVMRPSRNTFYGHPVAIAYIRALAVEMRDRGWDGLLVGDIAQPRGGPVPRGHRSHQTGLDIDIWFLPAPPRTLSLEEREQISAVSMVDEAGTEVDGAYWAPGYSDLLRTAASFPEVDRIFVNAAIKRELCRTVAGEGGDWLGKIRPWWGHDDHFHVGLRCPPGDAECVDRPRRPPGDGCDATLDWWFSEEAKEELRKLQAAPPKPVTLADLPPACQSMLAGAADEPIPASGGQ
jgi:penicillin-insensitive murein endopeptidase